LQSSVEIERSIAVLPFENLSPKREDTYFTVGMQDEIAGDLAKLSGMKVIGTQSTRSYIPGKERNLSTIGRDLGVRHLLEGTVSRDHDQMRVALHLVDLRDSSHRWTENYQRPIKDVFALQGEIAHAVAAQLKAALSPNEKAMLGAAPTDDLQAYDLYLRARALAAEILDGASFFRGGKAAIELLDQAVARDPSFVLAYCELAKWHDDLYFQRSHAPPEVRCVRNSKSAPALRRGKALLVNRAEMTFTLAFRNLFHDRIRLAVTMVGILFSIVLVAVQLGLYLGARNIIVAMIDRSEGDLWVMAYGTKNFEEAQPINLREKFAALSTPGVAKAVPLIVSFTDWRKPSGGSSLVVIVGADAEDGGAVMAFMNPGGIRADLVYAHSGAEADGERSGGGVSVDVVDAAVVGARHAGEGEEHQCREARLHRHAL